MHLTLWAVHFFFLSLNKSFGARTQKKQCGKCNFYSVKKNKNLWLIQRPWTHSGRIYVPFKFFFSVFELKKMQSVTNENYNYLLRYARNIKLERLEFETKRQQWKSQVDCIYIIHSVAIQYIFFSLSLGNWKWLQRQRQCWKWTNSEKSIS